MLNKIQEAFTKAGGQIYLVGGYVRDKILGIDSCDIDLTTDLLPEQTSKVMASIGAKVLDIPGGNYGTVHTLYKGEEIQVTTFRFNEVYDDSSRSPDTTKLEFSTNLEDDLLRRDFTCNSIAMTLDGQPVTTGVSADGQEAIRQRVLDTPQDPAISFSDDPLRILRAYRFRARLGFEFADRVRPAIRQCVPKLKKTSWERCRVELVKIAEGPSPDDSFRLMMQDGVLNYLIPELASQVGFDQENSHHHLPLWEHTLLAVKGAAGHGYKVVLAALLHDVGKPTSWQRVYQCPTHGKSYAWVAPYGHKNIAACECHWKQHTHLGKSFREHDTEGAKMTLGILERLRFSNLDRDDITKMVDRHIRWALPAWDIKQARKFLNDMGPITDQMVWLLMADRQAHAPKYQDVGHLIALQGLLADLKVDQYKIITNKPLIDGQAVMNLTGLAPGKQLGQVLTKLKEAQLEGSVTTIAEAEAFVTSLGSIA